MDTAQSATKPSPVSRLTFNRRGGLVTGLKIVLFLLALMPMARILYAIVGDPVSLGANPAEAILHQTGDWALQFLLITLAVTPLRKLTGWNDSIKFRRMLGNFSFFYALIHLSAYVAFDRLFDFSEIGKEIVKRPFILVGFAGFVLLLPLAITSTRGWIKRLGAQRWTQLHRAIYAIGVLGIVHYWWLVKRDITWPLAYGLVLALLLAYRLVPKRQKRAKR